MISDQNLLFLYFTNIDSKQYRQVDILDVVTNICQSEKWRSLLLYFSIFMMCAFLLNNVW